MERSFWIIKHLKEIALWHFIPKALSTKSLNHSKNECDILIILPTSQVRKLREWDAKFGVKARVNESMLVIFNCHQSPSSSDDPFVVTEMCHLLLLLQVQSLDSPPHSCKILASPEWCQSVTVHAPSSEPWYHPSGKLWLENWATPWPKFYWNHVVVEDCLPNLSSFLTFCRRWQTYSMVCRLSLLLLLHTLCPSKVLSSINLLHV